MSHARWTATSIARYNGGVRAKRQYGSSTLTDFFVLSPDGRSTTVKDVGGKTPGERKTRAIAIAMERLK